MKPILPKALLLVLLTTTFVNCKHHTSIDAYMTELAAKGEFNGNVLVVKNGTTLYEKSFGFVDGSKTHLLTHQHRFDLGSVYKEFPAVAIMQLQEKGLLHTDDKIDRYLKDLPGWASKISIKTSCNIPVAFPRYPGANTLEKVKPLPIKKSKTIC